MDPNAAKPDNPNIVNSGLEPPVNSADPLSNLQNVVDAAKAEAAAAQTTAPPQTPQAQFENQFGPGPATPTPTAPKPAPLDAALGSLGTAPPAEPEPLPKPEEAPLDPKQKFKDDVTKAADDFLKVLEEKKV